MKKAENELQDIGCLGIEDLAVAGFDILWIDGQPFFVFIDSDYDALLDLISSKKKLLEENKYAR